MASTSMSIHVGNVKWPIELSYNVEGDHTWFKVSVDDSDFCFFLRTQEAKDQFIGSLLLLAAKLESRPISDPSQPLPIIDDSVPY